MLIERDSLYFLAPLAQVAIGAITPLKSLPTAFRSGNGIPCTAYGEDFREGMGSLNRNMFLQLIPNVYLPKLTELDARLRAKPPARVADVGCGIGYPNVLVDGFDLDEASVAAAKANVWSAGLEGRVSIQWRDAGDPTLAGRYDLVTAFECIHDMSDPIGVLRTMRRLAAADETVLIGNWRAGDVFMAEGTENERRLYGFSLTNCLPVGMSERPSAGTGTAMRPSTLREYAQAAGFWDIEALPFKTISGTSSASSSTRPKSGSRAGWPARGRLIHGDPTTDADAHRL